MFYIRRVLTLCTLLWAACAACAFTFSYGEVLDIKDVQNKNGVLLMPLTNGKYKNVKVLSKDVYQFLLHCQKECQYPAASVHFKSVDYRRALTREGMWIADIDINDELVLVFLVFKNKDGFSVKAPQTVVFKDKKLLKQIEVYLTKLVEKTL